MAKYFNISHGLRGCYLPDSDPFVAMCKTRRDLKAIIESEASMIDSGGTQGFSKKAIASFVAQCWREAHKPRPAYLPLALPYKDRAESSYHNALFCSVEKRAYYLKYRANVDA